MSGGNRKSGSVVLAVLIVVLAGFPRSGFAKEKRVGFYAGPLSLVGETLVEKLKPATEETVSKAGEEPQQPRKNELFKAGRFNQPPGTGAAEPSSGGTMTR